MTRSPVRFSRAYWLILSRVACCFSESGRVFTATYQTTTARKGKEIATIQAKDGLVVKIKKTAQQKSLGREKRLVNLKGCFAVTDENALKGKHILVIDDVTTTGSTLTEIYHTIENCDPATVDFAVFART